MKDKKLEQHEQRVIEEATLLKEKIFNLQKFIEGNGAIYSSLHNKEKGDLANQLVFMIQYELILDSRIRRFYF